MPKTVYQINPKGFVAVGRERWTKRAQSYFKYKEDLQKLGVELPDAGAFIQFNMPIPKSWPKRKKEDMRGRHHQQTPDLSNLLKALEDAARYGDDQDDKTIWHYGGLAKIWADEGSIVVKTP